MDSLLNAAARALASGDPLAALDRVALRDDPPGLALRGVAMAQLGELARARELLRDAASGFGDAEPLARARCVTAEAEVRVAMRDLKEGTDALEAATRVLQQHDDHVNAAHAQLIVARRHVLLGEVDLAERALLGFALERSPPVIRAIAELLAADIALRSVRVRAARQALSRARDAASSAGIRALQNEVDKLIDELDKPAARLLREGAERAVVLAEVEALRQSTDLVIDACRRVVRLGEEVRRLTTRPVLFALARGLSEAYPGDAPRETLMTAAFGMKRFNESLRVRLRVEIGRLRKEIIGVAEIRATRRGFVLVPPSGVSVGLLLPPVEGADAALVALLADGASWSTSSLALALGVSQRTVQRSLNRLAERQEVRSVGRARARRWLASPISAYTTALLLPGPNLKR